MARWISEDFRKSDKKVDCTYVGDFQMTVLSCSEFFPVLQNFNKFSKTMYFRGELKTKKRNKRFNKNIVLCFNSKGSLLKSARVCFYGLVIWALVVGPLVTDVTRRLFSNTRHFGVTSAVACHPGHGQGSSRVPGMEVVPFQLHEHIPKLSEQTIGASGPAEGRIEHGSARFQDLIENFNPSIVFLDEEENNEDRIMTDLCRRRLDELAFLVSQRWPNVKLRVTEAWDSEGRHLENSLHYEGRAVDITTSDLDRSKYPVLARLAVNAGFDWVLYNSKSHVHCSVKSESSQAAYKGRCFTGDSLVSRPNGKQVYMSAVKPGDDVYAVNGKGQIVTARILTFLDIQYNAIGIKFVAVELENGKVLKLTRNHLLYVSSVAENVSSHSHRMFDLYNVKEHWNKTIPGSTVKLLSSRPTFAGNVKPGQYVFVMQSSKHYSADALQPCKIISIRNINTMRGSYAPLTDVGNIIVDDVVASCYATIENEALAHLVLTPVRYFHIVRLWLKSSFNNINFGLENKFHNISNLSSSHSNQYNSNEGISSYSFILQTIGSYIFSKAAFWTI